MSASKKKFPVFRRRADASLVSGVALMVPLAVFGADDAVPRERRETLAENSVQLDEVLVRGQRIRASSTTDLSSKTAVSGERAEELGLRDLRDSLKVQGNTFVAPSNNGNNGISIRGINSEGIGEPGANSRPLATLLIDGAPQSIEGVRRGQRGTWDIESVEVVRGPQTMMTGRNTLAGSIAVRTNDPTDNWEGAARISVGEHDQFGPALMLSGPLNDEFAFRVAAESARGNKGIRYSDPSTDFLDNDEYDNVRGKLRYRPSALQDLSIKLTISDTHDDPSVTAVSGPDYEKRYFDVQQTAAERRSNDVRNNILDAIYEFEPGVVLISTTSYVVTDANLDGVGSFGGNPPASYSRDELRTDRDISQLLHYSHAPVGSTLGGEIGMFAGRFTNTRDSLVLVGPLVQQDIDSWQRDRAAAVFGEGFWEYVPRWRVIAGVRYESETTDQKVEYRDRGVRQISDYDNDVMLPKVGIVHELNDSDSIGATVATGYRGGFRQTETLDIASTGSDVDPEHMTNLDIAWRSSWFGGKVDISANAFYNKWRDQQISVNLARYLEGSNAQGASVLTTTLNAGESHSYGAELNIDWQITRSISAGTSVGLLRTKFDDLPLQDINLKGNEFPEAPHVSGGAWLVARFAERWFFSTDVSARGSAYATSDIWNDEDKKIPGYGLVNIRFGYEADYISTVFSVNNVANKDYLSGRDFRDGYYVGDPRWAGLTITARYF